MLRRVPSLGTGAGDAGRKGREGLAGLALIGRHELEVGQRIGAGSFGEVWEATVKADQSKVDWQTVDVRLVLALGC